MKLTAPEGANGTSVTYLPADTSPSESTSTYVESPAEVSDAGLADALIAAGWTRQPSAKAAKKSDG
jgi:hypothetical protein